MGHPKRDLIAERVAYLEGRGPKPEAEYTPPGAALAAGLISAHAPG